MKVEVKETQSNEVDWSKNPQLVKYEKNGDFYIVLTNKESTNMDFEGTIVYSNIALDDKFFIGVHKKSLLKTYFKPFHGTITLQND